MRTRTFRPWPSFILFTLTLTLVCSGLVGCTTNAATGKSQFNMMSREDEIKLGEEAKPQLIDQYGGRIDDAYMQAYVTEVGMRMVPFIEGDYGELPWEFIVLDSDVINAFALPGGKVFITRGLLVELEDEAMLAGVLGHEIGHVTAEHADKQVSNQMIFSGILIGASVAAGFSDDDLVQVGVPLLVGVGGQGFLLKFGRGDELQADSLGMRYMSRAGYDPAAQRDVMVVLKEASGGGSGSAGSGGRPPEFLSTHPYPETRIDRINKALEKDYPPSVRASLARDRPAYQQNVIGRLPDEEQ